jgi:hypothetical protein
MNECTASNHSDRTSQTGDASHGNVMLRSNDCLRPCSSGADVGTSRTYYAACHFYSH